MKYLFSKVFKVVFFRSALLIVIATPAGVIIQDAVAAEDATTKNVLSKPVGTTELIGELATLLDRYEETVAENKVAFSILRKRLKSYRVKRNDAESQLLKYSRDLEELKLKHKKSKKVTRLGYEIKHLQLEKILKTIRVLDDEAKDISSSIEVMSRQIMYLSNKISNLDYRNKVAHIGEEKKPEKKPEKMLEPKKKESQSVYLGKSGSISYARAKPTSAIGISSDSTPSESNTIVNTEPFSKITDEKIHHAPTSKKTPMQQQARRAMNRLFEKTKGADKAESHVSLELVLSESPISTVDLEYLGNEQFYTEVQINKGKHTLRINRKKFNIAVPQTEGGDVFVIIYDNKKVQIAAFNKKLLH